MNAPPSVDEYKAEIARYVDAFACSLPAQIDAPGISRVKLPGIATWSRETLLWRFTGLAQDALEKLNQKRLASAMLLTRAAVETVAALWYLDTKIKRALASGEIAELDEKLKRLVFGQKDPSAQADGLPAAINVVTFLEHVEKEFRATLANTRRCANTRTRTTLGPRGSTRIHTKTRA